MNTCLSCGIVLVNVSHKTWFCHRKFDTVICSPVRLGFIFLCILKLEKHIWDIPSLSGSQAVYGKVYCNLMKIIKVAHHFLPLHLFHSGKKHSLGCIDITVLSKKLMFIFMIFPVLQVSTSNIMFLILIFCHCLFIFIFSIIYVYKCIIDIFFIKFEPL